MNAYSGQKSYEHTLVHLGNTFPPQGAVIATWLLDEIQGACLQL